MQSLKRHIQNQIAANSGKNLLSDNVDKALQFIAGTDFITNHLHQLKQSDKFELIDFVTEKVIEELCKLNQYYSFDSKAKSELSEIYTILFDELKDGTKELVVVSSTHYKRLQEWLIKTNPFAEELYKKEVEKIESIPCFEYSANLQMQLLKIDLATIQEPILDIGCGNAQHLVNYFKGLHLDCYGIDRLTENTSVSQKADWLDYDFGIEKWGSIISHLGFSNHFIHHNLRSDGNYVAYAKKYLQILESLKIEGHFYYAPDLPFIEGYLDKEKFSLQRHSIKDTEYIGVIIERLK